MRQQRSGVLSVVLRQLRVVMLVLRGGRVLGRRERLRGRGGVGPHARHLLHLGLGRAALRACLLAFEHIGDFRIIWGRNIIVRILNN